MMEMLSRWQFGVTITYHFLFVPLTIGLALARRLGDVAVTLPTEGGR